MPNYLVKAINIASFPLGEADKVLTVFSAEKGPIKVIAKGARKPGTKMAGRSEVLCVNELFLASGRTFQIVTQAQTIESFSELRQDLSKLSYALLYAELTSVFAEGLAIESAVWYEQLLARINLLAAGIEEPAWLALEFQMGLLKYMGVAPELTFCVHCRNVLTDYILSRFNSELGGIVCLSCVKEGKRQRVGEFDGDIDEISSLSAGLSITPLVWKNLVLADQQQVSTTGVARHNPSRPEILSQAERLLRSHIEHRAGKKLKSADFIEQMRPNAKAIKPA